MTNLSPSVYLDANVPAALRQVLEAGNFNVVLAAGTPQADDDDPTILLTAARQRRILITINRPDFRRLSGLWNSLVTWGHQEEGHPGILSCYGSGDDKVPRPRNLDEVREWGEKIIELVTQAGAMPSHMYVYRWGMRAWEREPVGLV